MTRELPGHFLAPLYFQLHLSPLPHKLQGSSHSSLYSLLSKQYCCFRSLHCGTCIGFPPLSIETYQCVSPILKQTKSFILLTLLLFSLFLSLCVFGSPPSSSHWNCPCWDQPVTWITESIRLFSVLLLLGDSIGSDTLPLLDSLFPPLDLWHYPLLGFLLLFFLSF